MSKTGASFARGKSHQSYSTPADFMEAVAERFDDPAWDLAASADNTKAHRFIDKEMNSLIQPWHEYGGWLWLNPPFDNIAPWAKKCAEESKLGASILFLTPASVGANWFRDYVHRKAYVLALNGRLSFDGKNGFPKDCCLSVYSNGLTGFDTWTWKTNPQKADSVQS